MELTNTNDTYVFGTIASVIQNMNASMATYLDLNTSSNWSDINNTINITISPQSDFEHVPKYDLPAMVVICILLSLLILSTVLGNVFVIAAVLLERSLQGVSNYLILSLAMADLLVAVCVLPLSLVNEISVHWYLGNRVCDFWTSMDVLCCTASILHLVAIALDRFWGVSNIDYIRRRSKKHILKMIAVVWLVAFCISIPPLFGWKEEANNPERVGKCMISQNLVYTIFSTIGAFYCPLVLMVFLNFKIYIVARSRIRKKNFGGFNKPVPSAVTNAELKTCGQTSSCSEDDGYTMCNGTLAVNTALNEEMQYSLDTLNNSNSGNGTTGPPCAGGLLTVPKQHPHVHALRRSNGHVDGNDLSCVTRDTEMTTFSNPVQASPKASPHPHHSSAKTDNNNHKHSLFSLKKKRREADRKRKDKLEMKRERKAAKVLGIITGAFIACWLPFFILAVLAPFCGPYCHIPDDVFSICLWLGYFNSSLNPILYTIFNPSFRKAFNKIIFGRYRIRM